MVMTGGTTADQIRLLEGGQVDVALLRAPVSLPAGLRQVRAAEEELGVLMWAAHPLAAQEEIEVADLAGRELILFPRQRAPQFHEPLTVTYAAAWRSDSRSPTLAPVVGALSRGLLRPPDQER
jgi:DNA-binding transcriptional LysR family regulator